MASKPKPPHVLCATCQVAQLQYNEGRIVDAEQTCLSIMATDPGHVEIILLLAAIHYACGRFERYCRVRVCGLTQQSVGAESVG